MDSASSSVFLIFDGYPADMVLQAVVSTKESAFGRVAARHKLSGLDSERAWAHTPGSNNRSWTNRWSHGRYTIDEWPVGGL